MNKTKKNKSIILKDKNLSTTEAFQKITTDYKTLPKNKKVKQSDVDNFKYNKEELDSKDIGLNSNYSYLYPNLNDPNFNIKISEKKNFLIQDTMVKLKMLLRNLIYYVMLNLKYHHINYL